VAAEQGVPQAQYSLGRMYANGIAVEADPSEALRWFRLAADQGFAVAESMVGISYFEGLGIKQDYDEAVRWTRRAADRDFAPAQAQLGRMYAIGAGVRQDYAEALRWTRLAADRAEPNAQNNMGNFYALGVGGMARDDNEASRWFRLSAAQGNAVGRFNLGVMYRDGRGVERDLGEAVRLFRLAAAQGNVQAAEAIRDLGPAASVPARPAIGAAAPVTNVATADTSSPAAIADSRIAPPAAAGAIGRRIALVIGISAYGSIGNLPNPANDARALAAALHPLGFDVELVVDPDQRALRRAISGLGERMSSAGPGTTGLFFFAGHGIQSRGTNYLIPAGAAIQREADLELEAVSATTVLLQMQEAGVSTNIIILDACRNMPLTRSFRNAASGLVQMDAPNGTFISYSTGPGSVAADGSGDHSPFAAALLNDISRPGQPIEVVFRNVRRNVLLATEGEQTPWDASSLVDPFFFVAG
jgi:TPR repeat protein